jgi:hypothetical protein
MTDSGLESSKTSVPDPDHMFLGLPDPDPSIIKQTGKKYLDSYCDFFEK